MTENNTTVNDQPTRASTGTNAAHELSEAFLLERFELVTEGKSL